MPDLVNVALQLLHSLSQLANILLAGIGNLCKLNNTNTWTHAFHHMHKTLCMSAYDPQKNERTKPELPVISTNLNTY